MFKKTHKIILKLSDLRKNLSNDYEEFVSKNYQKNIHSNEVYEFLKHCGFCSHYSKLCRSLYINNELFWILYTKDLKRTSLFLIKHGLIPENANSNNN